MNINVEVIMEAAELISKFPNDIKVLKEQKRIFNEYVNVLISKAEAEVEK